MICYYYRLAGKLTSDKPRTEPPFHTNFWDYPNDRHRVKHAPPDLPPWRTEWNELPPIALERKLRRREKRLSRSPQTSIRRKESFERLTPARARSYSPQRRQQYYEAPRHSPQPRSRALQPYNIVESPRERFSQPSSYRPTTRGKSPSLKSRPPTPGGSLSRRKSPQRVSFKSKPKIYQRTPDSSISGERNPMAIQTVV